MKRLWLAGWLLAGALPAGETNQTGQVYVRLTDGSRLTGVTTLREVVVESASLGKVTVPVSRLRSLQRAPATGVVTLSFRNGDSLQGTTALTQVPLRTVFGDVQVPVTTLESLQVAGADPDQPPPFTGDPGVAVRETLTLVRQIDMAIDEWALEKGKTNGSTVVLSQVAEYLPEPLAATLRQGRLPKDPVGYPLLLSVVGSEQIKVHPKTKAELAEARPDWGGF